MGPQLPATTILSASSPSTPQLPATISPSTPQLPAITSQSTPQLPSTISPPTPQLPATTNLSTIPSSLLASPTTTSSLLRLQVATSTRQQHTWGHGTLSQLQKNNLMTT